MNKHYFLNYAQTSTKHIKRKSKKRYRTSFEIFYRKLQEKYKVIPQNNSDMQNDKAHSAGSTVENPQGTAFLNQQHVLNQIDKYADKT
jgi:hypothetical protein